MFPEDAFSITYYTQKKKLKKKQLRTCKRKAKEIIRLTSNLLKKYKQPARSH